MRMILVLLLGFSMTSIGCSTITLHPVTDKDIKMLDGWVCMTPEYVKEVMKARIEEKAK